MKYPIYIPSKGRAENSTTCKLLQAENIPFYIVIEPQDVQAYTKEYPTADLLVLPENDMGITYVRNFILDKGKLHPHFLMMDDDITKFYTTINKKNVPVLAKEALNYMEEFAEKYNNFAMIGMEYQQFAWSSNHRINTNSYCEVIVLLNSKLVMPFKYRAVDGKEDRDFVLQNLVNGNDVARISKYSFAAPKNGSNAGGLSDVFYKQGKEALACQKMIEMWGEHICQIITKKDGRTDLAINWKMFKRDEK